MLERLATDAGAAAYAKRKTTVEPVFGNLRQPTQVVRWGMSIYAVETLGITLSQLETFDENMY